ncbi:MAG TPA: PAS domain S-box protein [Baekduia sp.]|nr:PAS domain S-box protein [Baekduia sp.]
MRLRQIAPVTLVLALTVAGFIGARLLGDRDARRDSDHRADVAAAQIRGRLDQGASLAESLRRFMVGVGGRGVTGAAFESNAARWLSPAGFPAAAWVEQVPDAGRDAYERRIGHRIQARGPGGELMPVATRPAYLPATLVSSIPPMAVPGIDLGAEVGVAAALRRAGSLYDAGATPLTTLRDGTKGLFLVKLAPRLSGGVVRPGFVMVFLPELWLRAAATDTPALRLAVGGAATGRGVGPDAADATFTALGQRFDVAVPRQSVHGAAAVLPWIILAAGVVLAALAGALGVNGARRARAQNELDRIFTLSPDLITVAGFDGRFKRINPAVEQVLGYTQEELVNRPYMDLVHPDDRARTAAEADAIGAGKTTMSFENRFVRKDGSHRVLEWTTTPVVQEKVMYGMARDVTERRQAETELERLAGEQAALRRVATLVARGVPAAEVFTAVAEEVGRLFGAQATAIGRLEPDGTTATVASSGTAAAGVGTTVTAPIMVEGSPWGSIVAESGREPFPPDAEQRMSAFTELAATAIANAESRSELTASRARVVAASDATRRQIERDLHDGAQQRLVHTVITLRLAHQSLQAGSADAPELVSEALDQAEQATVELRELVQGILPPVLTHGGLPPAVESLTSRMPVPVELAVDVDRLPPAVEATAYFVVAEGLTNVVKHARATRAAVAVRVEDGHLQLRVRDDGIGGARRDGGGFVGLADRLAVLDGHLRVESPPGGGTLVAVDIPLPGEADR